MAHFLRKCKGFVGFDIIGEAPERLYNLLVDNGVDVWSFRRRKDVLSGCMECRDYLKIRPLCRKVGVKTRVTGRYGLPFFLKKHRLRIGFFAGVVLFLVSLFFLSGFIWNVDVVGNQSIPTSEILTALDTLGLREGVRRKGLDPEALRMNLALKVDGIAWASINIEGVKATVNIAESRPLKGDADTPCNLVAERDGVIVAVEVESGTSEVKVGQSVAKGDRLVSGLTEYKDGTYKFVPSKGRIYAQTEREISCFVPFCQSVTDRSGQAVTRYAVSFFGVKIPLYLGSVKGSYETEQEIKHFERDTAYIPVRLYKTVFFKTETSEILLSEDEARQMAEEDLKSQESELLQNVEILHKSIEIQTVDGGILLTAKYSLKENIAKKDLLLILD